MMGMIDEDLAEKLGWCPDCLSENIGLDVRRYEKVCLDCGAVIASGLALSEMAPPYPRMTCDRRVEISPETLETFLERFQEHLKLLSDDSLIKVTGKLVEMCDAVDCPFADLDLDGDDVPLELVTVRESFMENADLYATLIQGLLERMTNVALGELSIRGLP